MDTPTMLSSETRSAMCGILALFFLTSASGNSSPSPSSKLQHEPFIGHDRWEPEYLDMCEMDDAQQNSLYCGMYDFNYQRIHFEVVSDEPILIIFRNLLSPQHVEALLDDISTMDIYPQKVINMSSEKYDNMDDTSRVANGTYIHHHATPQFAKAFKISQQALPFVNFYTSESWQVLSYLPGGHYAHHYDYIIYKEEASYDDGWKSTGNRFATFLIVLQNAEQGGGTVFPQLNTTVKASPGDAIFWINMDAEQKCVSCLPHDPVICKRNSDEKGSLHGGCVVWKGEKIVTVLWIRALHQDILQSASSEGVFDISKLIAPDPHFHGMCHAEDELLDFGSY